MLGFLILIAAVIGGSSIGVVSNFIPAQGSFTKSAWRNAEIAICVAPLAILECCYLKSTNSPIKIRLLTLKENSLIMLQALALTGWGWGLMVGCSNLIQSQAYVLNNMHGFWIVIYLVLRGVSITKHELLGMILASIGCFCLIIDPHAKRNDISTDQSVS